MLVAAAEKIGVSKNLAILLIDPFLEPMPLEQPSSASLKPHSDPAVKHVSKDDIVSMYSPPSVFHDFTDQQARSVMVLSPISKGIDKNADKMRKVKPNSKQLVRRDTEKIKEPYDKFHKRRKIGNVPIESSTKILNNLDDVTNKNIKGRDEPEVISSDIIDSKIKYVDPSEPDQSQHSLTQVLPYFYFS